MTDTTRPQDAPPTETPQPERVQQAGAAPQSAGEQLQTAASQPVPQQHPPTMLRGGVETRVVRSTGSAGTGPRHAAEAGRSAGGAQHGGASAPSADASNPGHSPATREATGQGLTPEALARAMPGLSMTGAREYAPLLAQAMREAHITTQPRAAAFLAQIGHESVSLRFNHEIWGNTRAQRGYEGRRDLGNTHSGDGYRYRGRGFLQITGRANYSHYGQLLHMDLVGNPDMAARADVAARIAALYWQHHGLNELADRGDYERITRRINGGLNGWANRVARLHHIQQLGNQIVPTAAGHLADMQEPATQAPAHAPSPGPSPPPHAAAPHGSGEPPHAGATPGQSGAGAARGSGEASRGGDAPHFRALTPRMDLRRSPEPSAGRPEPSPAHAAAEQAHAAAATSSEPSETGAPPRGAIYTIWDGSTGEVLWSRQIVTPSDEASSQHTAGDPAQPPADTGSGGDGHADTTSHPQPVQRDFGQPTDNPAAESAPEPRGDRGGAAPEGQTFDSRTLTPIEPTASVDSGFSDAESAVPSEAEPGGTSAQLPSDPAQQNIDTSGFGLSEPPQQPSPSAKVSNAPPGETPGPAPPSWKEVVTGEMLSSQPGDSAVRTGPSDPPAASVDPSAENAAPAPEEAVTGKVLPSQPPDGSTDQQTPDVTPGLTNWLAPGGENAPLFADETSQGQPGSDAASASTPDSSPPPPEEEVVTGKVLPSQPLGPAPVAPGDQQGGQITPGSTGPSDPPAASVDPSAENAAPAPEEAVTGKVLPSQPPDGSTDQQTPDVTPGLTNWLAPGGENAPLFADETSQGQPGSDAASASTPDSSPPPPEEEVVTGKVLPSQPLGPAPVAPGDQQGGQITPGSTGPSDPPAASVDPSAENAAPAPEEAVTGKVLPSQPPDGSTDQQTPDVTPGLTNWLAPGGENAPLFADETSQGQPGSDAASASTPDSSPPPPEEEVVTGKVLPSQPLGPAPVAPGDQQGGQITPGSTGPSDPPAASVDPSAENAAPAPEEAVTGKVLPSQPPDGSTDQQTPDVTPGLTNWLAPGGENAPLFADETSQGQPGSDAASASTPDSSPPPPEEEVVTGKVLPSQPLGPAPVAPGDQQGGQITPGSTGPSDPPAASVDPSAENAAPAPEEAVTGKVLPSQPPDGSTDQQTPDVTPGLTNWLAPGGENAPLFADETSQGQPGSDAASASTPDSSPPPPEEEVVTGKVLPSQPLGPAPVAPGDQQGGQITPGSTGPSDPPAASVDPSAENAAPAPEEAVTGKVLPSQPPDGSTDQQTPDVTPGLTNWLAPGGENAPLFADETSQGQPGSDAASASTPDSSPPPPEEEVVTGKVLPSQPLGPAPVAPGDQQGGQITPGSTGPSDPPAASVDPSAENAAPAPEEAVTGKVLPSQPPDGSTDQQTPDVTPGLTNWLAPGGENAPLFADDVAADHAGPADASDPSPGGLDVSSIDDIGLGEGSVAAASTADGVDQQLYEDQQSGQVVSLDPTTGTPVEADPNLAAGKPVAELGDADRGLISSDFKDAGSDTPHATPPDDSESDDTGTPRGGTQRTDTENSTPIESQPAEVAQPVPQPELDQPDAVLGGSAASVRGMDVSQLGEIAITTAPESENAAMNLGENPYLSSGGAIQEADSAVQASDAAATGDGQQGDAAAAAATSGAGADTSSPDANASDGTSADAGASSASYGDGSDSATPDAGGGGDVNAGSGDSYSSDSTDTSGAGDASSAPASDFGGGFGEDAGSTAPAAPAESSAPAPEASGGDGGG